MVYRCRRLPREVVTTLPHFVAQAPTLYTKFAIFASPWNVYFQTFKVKDEKSRCIVQRAKE